MDDVMKRSLEHYQSTHPGATIMYFDASEGIPVSALNSVDEPTFPPKTVYKVFPTKETNMSTNERDTHFLGFADALYKDMCLYAVDHPQADDATSLIQIIAQRAYDLVLHAISHIYKDAIYTEAPNYDKFMFAIVPDLTQWPESSTDQSS